MKTHRSAFLGLVLLLASLLPAFAGDAKVGDTVAAKWTDGNTYIATITGISGDRLNLLYDDGDKLTVTGAEVRVIPQNATFKVGDHVLAVWKTAQMFPGVISAVNEATCTVKWDDGDAPLDVKKGRIILTEK